MTAEKLPFLLTEKQLDRRFITQVEPDWEKLLMFHWHPGTMTPRSESLHQEVPEAYVEIHPDDAAAIGLNGASRVRVSSRRGAIELAARVTPHIKPGVVFVPFHFAEAAANVLTHAALDPTAKIPEYKVCAVQIEACGSTGRGSWIHTAPGIDHHSVLE